MFDTVHTDLFLLKNAQFMFLYISLSYTNRQYYLPPLATVITCSTVHIDEQTDTGFDQSAAETKAAQQCQLGLCSNSTPSAAYGGTFSLCHAFLLLLLILSTYNPDGSSRPVTVLSTSLARTTVVDLGASLTVSGRSHPHQSVMSCLHLPGGLPRSRIPFTMNLLEHLIYRSDACTVALQSHRIK